MITGNAVSTYKPMVTPAIATQQNNAQSIMKSLVLQTSGLKGWLLKINNFCGLGFNVFWGNLNVCPFLKPFLFFGLFISSSNGIKNVTYD